MKEKYTINDLPAFSKWPSRLLGAEPWEQKKKTKKEIDREYELESWGFYLNKAKHEGLINKITVKTLDDWQCSPDLQILYSKDKKFLKNSFKKAYHDFINTIKRHLKKHIPVDYLVELGAGFGSVILSVAEDPRFKNTNFMAAEYAPSGVELIKICAKNQKINLQTGNCDFMKNKITDLKIPHNSVIYTAAAACTLPKLPNTFITSILSYKPKTVIHFEPVYELLTKNDLLTLMRKKYIEVNDYNRNLLSLLKSFEKKNKIKIIEEVPLCIGVNPLFPVSIISWKPVNKIKRG